MDPLHRVRPLKSDVLDNCFPLYTPLHTTTLPAVERELLHHYFNHSLPRLVSPTWNKAHFMVYQGQVMDLILNFQSVRYAVFAGCASNKFMLSSNSRYEKISLEFYSRAVKKVNLALDEMCSNNSTPSDALLVSVIYLYVRDVSILPSKIRLFEF